MKIKSVIKIVTVLSCVIGLFMGMAPATYAAGTFSVSPMNQKIVLTPGETYEGAFKVTNPESSVSDFAYVARVTPFYVNDNYDIVYTNNGDYNQIVDWVTIINDHGSIAPNETKEIRFTIDVPSSAPAGGQYAAITVSSEADDSVQNAINIQTRYAIAHIIYAEIAGTTERGGEIFGIDIPGFLLSGNIKGYSSIKNTGNVHSTAKYTLQVFPLFSNEEVYTNEEAPIENIILPDRTLYNETVWTDTPLAGIFNVVYTVEFEGITKQASKMVIVCPIWLLFIIIFVVMAIIIFIVLKVKNRGKASKK